MSNQASADAVFEALGEPVRRRILELLREGPAPVGRLAERLPVGRPAVSKHQRVLSGAGLVNLYEALCALSVGLISHRSVGTRNLYALVPGGLAPAQQWLTATWDSALAAFAGYVSQAGNSQAENRGEPAP